MNFKTAQPLLLGTAKVVDKLDNKPVYFVTIDKFGALDSLSPKGNINVSVGLNSEKELILYKSINGKDQHSIINLNIDLNKLRSEQINGKAYFIASPKFDQVVSRNFNNDNYNAFVYQKSANRYNLIGGGKLLVNERKEDLDKGRLMPKERFDYNVVGYMDKEGLISLNTSNFDKNIDNKEQLSLYFKKLHNEEKFVCFTSSDKRNLNFDYKLDVEYRFLKDQFIAKDLQAFIVKDNKFHDIFLTTNNKYMTAFNEYMIGNTKEIVLGPQDILGKGQSLNNIINRWNNPSNNQENKQAYIPSIEVIKGDNHKQQMSL